MTSVTVSVWVATTVNVAPLLMVKLSMVGLEVISGWKVPVPMVTSEVAKGTPQDQLEAVFQATLVPPVQVVEVATETATQWP